MISFKELCESNDDVHQVLLKHGWSHSHTDGDPRANEPVSRIYEHKELPNHQLTTVDDYHWYHTVDGKGVGEGEGGQHLHKYLSRMKK